MNGEESVLQSVNSTRSEGQELSVLGATADHCPWWRTSPPFFYKKIEV